MWQDLQSIIESLFIGPVWPASVLLLLVLGYLMLCLGGAIFVAGADVGIDGADIGIDGADVGLPGADIDINADSWQSLGVSTFRWLHFHPVPVVIWGGLFACINWLLAFILWRAFDSQKYDPTILISLFLAARNAVIAGVVTRIATAPLAPCFRNTFAYSDETLVGQSCIVSSGEATATFGQAKYDTGSAPLLLNIRTDGPQLKKGTSVRIVSFDPSKRTYRVTSDTGPPSEMQT